MKIVDIIHVYGGTAGSAGLYLDSIYRSLQGKFEQICIVNAYFPFKYGKKVFYRHTEMTGPNLFGNSVMLRRVVRYLELLGALLISLFYTIWYRPKILNYSMTSNLMVEYVFLFLVKKITKVKVVLTCHDVAPFQTDYSNREKDIARRMRFFNLADRLIVHNKNSHCALVNDFSISGSKILAHRFPIMDLKRIQSISEEKVEFKAVNKKLGLLFVGHLRKEKGVRTLLDAWESEEFKNLSLTIAGNIPPGQAGIFENISSSNTVIINKFLTDDEYANYIRNSDFVILPYLDGTNSGIPGSALSLGSIPITSNIPMFQNNELVFEQYMFNPGEVNSLVAVLRQLNKLKEDDLAMLVQSSLSKLMKYKSSFDDEVNRVYKDII